MPYLLSLLLPIKNKKALAVSIPETEAMMSAFASRIDGKHCRRAPD